MNSLPISTVITSEALLQSDKRTRRFALFKSLQASIIQVSKSSCLLVFVYLSAARAIHRLAKTIRILLVQLCCTFGAAMLHCWYTYAGPLVYLCWTFGIPMLNLWYTYAEPLVPECFTLLVPFFQFVYRQYQGENQNEEWRMKNEEWRMKNEEWRIVGFAD